MADDSYGMGIPLPPDSTKVHQFPGVTRLAMERVAEILAGGLTPATEAAIASGVAAAAGPAVDAELESAGVLTGASPVPADDVAISFTDEDDFRSFLEAAPHGGPTQHSANLIGDALAGIIAAAVAAGAATAPLSTESGYAFAITDEDDNIAFGIRTDATTTADLDTEATPATHYADTYAGAPAKIVAGPDIAQVGDSLTAAGHLAAKVAALTGRTVHNMGVGGETSPGIAARQGGMPYLMAPVGGSIPAAGGVDVTFKSAYGPSSWPLLQGTGVRNTADNRAVGTLAGVTGVLTLIRPAEAVQYVHHANDRYVFTRLVDGAAVPVNKPMPFYYLHGANRRGDIQVIWQGQNGPDDDTTFAMFAAEIQYMSALDKRYLLMTAPGVTHTGWTPMELRMLAAHGRRYMNVRRYLIDHALTDLGMTPTAQDEADIAAGTVPTSLRTDAVHHTQQAQEAIAEFLEFPRLKEMGWV